MAVIHALSLSLENKKPGRHEAAGLIDETGYQGLV